MRYFFLLLFMVSCQTSPNQPFDLDKYYKFDGKVCNKTNETCFNGFGVFPKTKRFDGKYYAHGKIDFFHVGSCHRSRPLTELCSYDLENNKKLRFSICDIDGIEGAAGCGFKFFAAEKQKGRHSFALVFFESEQLQLGAHMQCNGRNQKWNGTSVCQSAAGNFQAISFARPVRFSKKGFNDCPDLERLAPNEYKFNIGLGVCAYTFTDGKNFHSMITYGHEREPIRVIEPNDNFWFFGGE